MVLGWRPDSHQPGLVAGQQREHKRGLAVFLPKKVEFPGGQGFGADQHGTMGKAPGAPVAIGAALMVEAPVQRLLVGGAALPDRAAAGGGADGEAPLSVARAARSGDQQLAGRETVEKKGGAGVLSWSGGKAEGVETAEPVALGGGGQLADCGIAAGQEKEIAAAVPS